VADPSKIHMVGKGEVPIMHDGAGKLVTPREAAEAVKWFGKLWEEGTFDCQPQDYEFMVKECLIVEFLFDG
jgi:hypothetical protein